MILTHCEHDTVLYVARNMRERDHEEIYNLRWDANPFTIVNDVMANPNFSWVGGHDGRPVAVFGGMPHHPGVWSMYCFATDDFPKVALGITRFMKRIVVPKMFGEMGIHRLQCDSHEKHVQAHRWLRLFGARQEGVKWKYGRDGANYFTFTLTGISKSTKATP